MKEFVSFFLSGKKYGADISQMQGIEKYRDLISGIDLPECLHGVIDVRGEIIPVVDIRKYLILPPSVVTSDSQYIVFLTSHGKLSCMIDGVSQILKADNHSVQKIPELMKSDQTGYLECIVKNQDELIIVINPDMLLTGEDWAEVEKTLTKIQQED